MESKILQALAEGCAERLEQIFYPSCKPKESPDDRRLRDDRDSHIDTPQRGIPHQTIRPVRWY